MTGQANGACFLNKIRLRLKRQFRQGPTMYHHAEILSISTVEALHPHCEKNGLMEKKAALLTCQKSGRRSRGTRS